MKTNNGLSPERGFVSGLLKLILFCGGIVLLTASIGIGSPATLASSFAPDVDITEFIHKEFGNDIQPMEMEGRSYFEGDFNNDGYKDIAITLSIEKGYKDLKRNGVQLFGIDPFAGDNGRAIAFDKFLPHNCAALAIVHGSADGWRKPIAKFIGYDCFSSAALYSKSKRIVRAKGHERPPVLAGDAISLKTENGATNLVYWTGAGYKGYWLSGGD